MGDYGSSINILTKTVKKKGSFLIMKNVNKMHELEMKCYNLLHVESTCRFSILNNILVS